LLGAFYAERLLDEQFLTLSPSSPAATPTFSAFSLVMGQAFAPRILYGEPCPT